MIKILFFLTLVLSLSACQHCQPTTEPTLYVTFLPSKTYTKFRTLNDSTYFSINNHVLPLAINQDTTRIIVKNSSSEDTLILSYNRTFEYKNGNCGYEITLSNFKLIPTSTFKSGTFLINNNSKISASYALNLLN